MAQDYDVSFLRDEREKGLQGSPVAPTATSRKGVYDVSFLRDEREAKLQGSLTAASRVAPEVAGRTQMLSEATGLPFDVVERNHDEVARLERVRRMKEAAALSPSLAAKMADPAFARITQDDTPALRRIAEGVGRSLAADASQLGRSLLSGTYTLLGAGAKVADAVATSTGEEAAARAYKNDPEGLKRYQASPADFLARFSRAMQQASERTMENRSADAKAAYDPLKYATRSVSEAAYLSPVKILSDALQSLPSVLALAVSARVTKGVVARVEARALAAQMAPEAARKAAVIAGGKTMALMTAGTEGAMSYGQTAMQVREQADKITDAELAKTPAYQKLLAEDFTPETARAHISAQAAEAAGVGAGVWVGATNLVGGRLLGHLIAQGGKLLPRTFKGGAVEGLTEAPQSGGEKASENLAVQMFLDAHRAVLDDVEESTVQGLTVGSATGGAFSAATGRNRQAKDADNNAEAFKKLFADAASSKLFERSKTTLTQFINEASADGPVPAVYVNATAFMQLAQQAGVDLNKALPDLTEALAQAAEGGIDVRIPTGSFVTAVAGTPLEQGAVSILRTDPNGPTQAEANDAAWAEETKAQTEAILSGGEFDDAQKASAAAVKSALLTQLAADSRFSPAVRDAYASKLAAFFAVQAHRLNITPEEMSAEYSLQFRSDARAGGRTLEQSDDGHTINVGLDIGDVKNALPVQRVLDAARALGLEVISHREHAVSHNGQVENTTVVRFKSAPTEQQVYALSIALEQDAIAGRSAGVGYLYGPRLEAYGGAFNPRFYKNEDGTQMHGVSVGAQQYDSADTKFAVHYSNKANLTTLEGSRSGEGTAGAEQKRVSRSEDPRIRRRVYFYESENGNLPDRETGLGTHVYKVALGNLYDLDADPRGIYAKIQSISDAGARDNARESAIIDEGFDGYYNHGTVVMLNSDVPVAYAGELGTFNQDWYYSELAKQVGNVPMKSGTPQAWKDLIRGLTQKGVKVAEIEAIGLNEWLDLAAEKGYSIVDGSGNLFQSFGSEALANAETDENGKSIVSREGYTVRANKLSRETVLEFIDDKGVRVEEQELTREGQDEYTETDYETGEPDYEFIRENAQETLDGLTEGEVIRRLEISAEEYAKDAEGSRETLLEDIIAEDTRAYYDDSDSPATATASFGGYDFTVVQAYGETTIRSNEDGREVAFAQGDRVEEVIRGYVGENWPSEGSVKFSDYQEPGGEEYTELLLILSGRELFDGGHFDAPNVIVHLRFNTRVAPDGVKVLFIEEIQSDWGQKGRDEGFVGEWLVRSDKDKKVLSRHRTAVAASEAVTTGQHVRIGEVEPAAFVMKSDAVIGLAVKRAIRHAAENGFGRVAWATGAQQVDRYGSALREKIDFLDWTKTAEGVHLEGWKGDGGRWPTSVHGDSIDGFFFGARGHDVAGPFATHAEATAAMETAAAAARTGAARGRKAVDTKHQESALSDAIGKAMADRIRNDPAESGTISGGDITVDSVGMAQVYGDEAGRKGDGTPAITTKVVNEILKKFGGGKVGAIPAGVGEAEFKYEGPNITVDRLRALATELPAGADPRGFTRQTISWLEHNPGGTFAELVEKTFRNNSRDKTRLDSVSRYLELPQIGGRVVTIHPQQPGFEVTKDLAANFLEGVPLFQKARGQITFGEDITKTPSVISLLAGADLSTFLHELGHFYLEVLTHMAGRADAPQEIKADLHKVLAWFDVTPEQWGAMTLEQKRPYHEQWARAHEVYLFEGKAPSAEMLPLFRRFSAWVTSVYRDLIAAENTSQQLQEALAKGAGAEVRMLTDEVRGVMDRLLATKDQILEAERTRSYRALFQTKPEGMTDADWAEYQALGLEATSTAIEKMQARSIRDMTWTTRVRSAALKRLNQEATKLRNEVRAEVAAEVAAEPVYQAIRWVTHGEMTAENGEKIKANKGFRFNSAALAEMYPVTALATVDLTKLRGKTSPDGLHPDQIAEMFGFRSGDQLVREIIEAQPAREKIDGLTDQRMLERYGDLADPASISQAADEAVHNEVRAKHVATELSALTKAVGNRNLLMKAAREQAASIVGRTKLKALKMDAHQYTAAGARAARKAEKALGADDLAAAATEKRSQMLNIMAAKAANEARAEVNKGVVELRRVLKGKAADIAKTRDVDVVMAARAVLAEYGIGTKGKAAQEYLKAVETNDPGMYAVLRDRLDAMTANAKPYTDLTMDEFRALHEEVAAMMYLARRSRQMEVDGDLMDRQEVAAELRARMEAIGIPDVVPGEGKAVTDSERRLSMLQTLRASLRRVEAWVGAKDGNAPFGPFRRYVWQQVKDAADQYRTAKAVQLKKYRALLDAIAPTLKPLRIDAPELGYAFGFSRGGSGVAEILHAILHTGNSSNKRKLLLGRGWAAENPDGTLDTGNWDAFIGRMVNEGRITKAHYDFAQGVWDTLEELKPLAQKTHRDVFGHYFAEITAERVETPFGVYAGGYVPAMADPEAVTDAKTRAFAEEENQTLQFAFPSTNKGFTKSRVEYNRPLLLDLRSVAQHIDKVLLFSHLEQPVRDVRRVLTSKGVGSALSRIDPAAFDGLLTPWLNRTARQQVEAPIPGSNGLMRFFSAARSRAGMTAMFANVSNTVQQIVTGPSTALLAVRPKYLMSAMADFVRSPREFARAVAEASPYMNARMENEVHQMTEAINDILLNPSVLERAQSWTMKHAYFLQAAADNVLSPVVWTGAYNQALEQGVSAADAKRLADTAVRETQGATQPEEVSRIESGNAFVRMFTQFAGYFNGQANTIGTEFAKVAQGVGLKKGAGRAFYVFLFGFLAPAWISEAVALAFKGGPDDEDKDGEYLDDWLAAVFGFGTLRYGTAMVPVVGQLTNTAVNTLNSKPYDDRISSAPAISMIESAVKAPSSVYKAIVEDGKPGRAVKDVATLLSITLGLPLYAVARPVSYLADVAADRVTPTDPVDAARGIITGTASPQSK